MIVADTSPLNYLVIIRAESVLPKLYDRVSAPPATIGQMLHSAAPTPVRSWASSPPEWLEIIAPTVLDGSIQLGAGEAEAISLAKEIKADALLIDDRKALAIAKQLGLCVTGTLGALELAGEQGILGLTEALAQLLRTNFQWPARLIEEMLRRHERRMQGG